MLSCKVSTAANGASRGYGFVQYESEDAAKQAIECVNGMLISGKKVFVGPFKQRSEQPEPAEDCSLYVRHVPETWEDEEQVGDEGQDTFYVAEKELAEIKTKLTEAKEITKDDVDKLTFPENLPDDAMMVPVDMRGIEQEFEDVEEMVEKLGPKGTGEAFVKAREYFEANNKDSEAQPMTAAEWRKVLEEDAMDDFGEDGEEDFMLEGEEEALDFAEDGEEEGEGGEDEELEGDLVEARVQEADNDLRVPQLVSQVKESADELDEKRVQLEEEKEKAEASLSLVRPSLQPALQTRSRRRSGRERALRDIVSFAAQVAVSIPSGRLGPPGYIWMSR